MYYGLCACSCVVRVRRCGYVAGAMHLDGFVIIHVTERIIKLVQLCNFAQNPAVPLSELALGGIALTQSSSAPRESAVGSLPRCRTLRRPAAAAWIC